MTPFGEFAPDVADYNVEVARVADGVIAGPNGYIPIPVPLGDEFGAHCGIGNNNCSGAILFKPGNETGVLVTAVLSNSSVPEFYVDDGNSFEQASLVQIANFKKFSFVPWDDDLYIFGRLTVPQTISYTGLETSGSTKTTDIGGSPPAAHHAAKVRDFIVLGSTYESSTHYYERVQWSGFAAPTDWTSGENQSGFADLSGGGEIHAVVGGEYGLIFQENQITRMNYIGSPQVWEFDTVEENRGCVPGSSVVKVGSDVYFLSKDGFYVLRDGQQAVPIGANKIDRWFLESATSTSDVRSYWYNTLWGAYDKATASVMWLYRDISTYTSQTSSDRVLIYNIKTNQWSTVTLVTAGNVLFEHSFARQGVTNYINRSSVGYVGASTVSNRAVLKFSGTGNLDASLETGHIYTEGKKTSITEVRPITDAGTVYVALITKDDLLSDSESETAAFYAPDASGKANFRSEARYHRIKVNLTGSWNHASGVEITQVSTGDR